MTMLIGTLLTMGLISLLCPAVLILIVFTIVMARITLWLCPSLRHHIEEQRTLYNDIDSEYEAPYIEHDMPEYFIYDMVDIN